MQKVLIILIQCLKNLRQGTSSLSEQGKYLSLWVKTSIRPLIDAVKENYELCDRLIIKEYCSVILLD